jgi:ADP-ribosylation factor 6
MGNQLSKMMGKIFGSREMRLLMLGLDAAGKTSQLSCTASKMQRNPK